MNWPMSQDYNEAIQNPERAFSDIDLMTGEVAVGPLGVPLPRSGNFADVYHIRGADRSDWAVKCFTRPVVGLDMRYAQVSDALARAKLPFTVRFTFLASGIRVSETWRPVVKMEWVEGLLLNQVVRENAGRPQILASLAQLWGKLCRRLREAGIAHADLQHGNVILVPGSRPGIFELKLIDYDGMFVPSLANTPTGETGHPAYQHPARTAKVYSPDLDRFPHLVVATALKALEIGGPALWAQYDNGDNLLFTAQDFRDPTKSKLMRELWAINNSELRALVGQLALSCNKPIQQTPWLDEIAPEGSPIPLDAGTAREAENALGLSAAVKPSSPIKPVKPTKPTKHGKVATANVESKPIALNDPKPFPIAPVEIDMELVPQDEEVSLEFEPEPKVIRLPLVIGGIVTLVLIVGLVAFFISSKPKEIAHNDATVVDEKADEVSTPRPSEHPKPKDSKLVSIDKPKEDNPETKSNVLKPIPDEPEPAPKKSTEPEPMPKKSPPIVKEPAILTPIWTVPVGTEDAPAKLYLDPETLTILVGSERTTLLAFELPTGTKRQRFVWFGLTGGNSFCPLDGSRVAQCLQDSPEIPSWDLKTWATSTKYPVPQIDPGAGKATHTCVHLSPDGRYLVVARSGASAGEYPAVPFCIFDNKTKGMLPTKDWTGGSTHFTSTSSRLLVAERNGRFRWFKLPTGEPTEEWDYGPPVEGHSHTVTTISKDGHLIGYTGPLKSQTESGPYLIDGKTGEPIHHFDNDYHASSPVVLSEDGRCAAVLRAISGDEAIIDVLTVPKCVVIARAKVMTKRAIPTFTLSDRGETLLVHDARSGKLYRFDLPHE